MNLFKELTRLGYTYKANSFGIDVFNYKGIVFHGREHEVANWLKEKGAI